jgi:hypothetical protein
MPDWVMLANFVVPVANIQYIVPKPSTDGMTYMVFLPNGLSLTIRENEAGSNWLRLRTMEARSADSVAAYELSGAEWPG